MAIGPFCGIRRFEAGTQAQAPVDVVDAEPGAEKVRATTP